MPIIIDLSNPLAESEESLVLTIGLKMFWELRGGCWGVGCWEDGCCCCWDGDWDELLPDRGVGGSGRLALALAGGSGTTISR